ncbi:MAG: GFA family protein [Myxococcota bacterium]
MKNTTLYRGGCHCGSVRFSVQLSPPVEVEDCNCSICAMSGNIHIIVPKAHFELLQGEDTLAEYSFNTHRAKHLFCSRCGVKSFYIPRSNPDGVAVTYRCLDDWRTIEARIEPFDGVNWEDNVARVAHKSKL